MVALHTAIAIGQPAQHHTQTEGVEAGGLRVVGDLRMPVVMGPRGP